MKTKKDIIKIINNYPDWCDSGKMEAIKFLEKFKDTDTLDFITEYAPEKLVFYWAKDIGDRKIMIKKIKLEKWAYHWGKDIGNKNIMKNKIISEEYAYNWALNIGDINIMKNKIKSDSWIRKWNKVFPNNKIEIKSEN